MAVHVRIGESQYPQERRAQDKLARFISDEWLLVSNPPFNRTGAEIDVLIIGPRGVIVAELKDWPNGTVARDSGQWMVDGKPAVYRNRERRRPNPVQQANNAARDFGKFFRKEAGARCRIDAVTLASPEGLSLVYEHEFVRDIARPIDEANELIECRVARGKQSEKLGCTPVSRRDIEDLLRWFGMQDLPEVKAWLSNTYDEAIGLVSERADAHADTGISTEDSEPRSKRPSRRSRKRRPSSRPKAEISGAPIVPLEQPEPMFGIELPGEIAGVKVPLPESNDRDFALPSDVADQGASLSEPEAQEALSGSSRAETRRMDATELSDLSDPSAEPAVKLTAEVPASATPKRRVAKKPSSTAIIAPKSGPWGANSEQDPEWDQTEAKLPERQERPTAEKLWGPRGDDNEPKFGQRERPDLPAIREFMNVLPGIPAALIALCAVASALGWIGQEPRIHLDTHPTNVIANVISDQTFLEICRANDLTPTECVASLACNPKEPTSGIRTVRLLLEGQCL